MKKINIDGETFIPFISTPHIESAIRNIAAALNAKFKYEQEPVVFISILNGPSVFAANLFTKLKFPITYDSIGITIHKDESGKEIIGYSKSLRDCNLAQRKIILVTDIIDTGYVVDMIKDMIVDCGGIDITTVSLFIKSNKYKIDHPEITTWGLISGEHQDNIIIGIDINDVYIIGYGLTYKNLGGNLNKIYVLEK